MGPDAAGKENGSFSAKVLVLVATAAVVAMNAAPPMLNVSTPKAGVIWAERVGGAKLLTVCNQLEVGAAIIGGGK